MGGGFRVSEVGNYWVIGFKRGLGLSTHSRRGLRLESWSHREVRNHREYWELQESMGARGRESQGLLDLGQGRDLQGI